MLNAADLYKQTETVAISRVVNGNTVQLGTLITEYEVRAFTDLRNLTRCRSYHLSCKQRVIMPSGATPDFSKPSNAFSDYPAIWQSAITFNPVLAGDQFQLIDYAPKTLNASISSNLSASTSTDTNVSAQYTTGSSTAVTNSYEVSANVGFSGEALSGGVSTSLGHSETDTKEASRSAGTSTGRNADLASSDSMSIKDWASYGFADEKNQKPSWVWGQEYPWNVLDYYYSDSGQYIVLPDFVQQRLVYAASSNVGAKSAASSTTKNYVVPPSNLSLYGINFLASARWLYPLPTPTTPIEEVTFTHTVAYMQGSHGLDTEGLLDVSLASNDLTLTGPSGHGGTNSYTSKPLNLTCLGLDPITGEGMGNGAVVGFVPSQFLLAPCASGLSITSGANNLLVTGTGFAAPSNADTPMSALVTIANPAKLKAQFKILSSDLELTLFLKHWKGSSIGCLLNIVINHNPAITRHLDSLESGSGTDNISKIILRNRDYTSAEFYDYLVMGLNTIKISIVPSGDPASDTGVLYVIRALAIN